MTTASVFADLATDRSDRTRLIERQRRALLDLQQGDGHLCFPLEADTTIPSEYVLLYHFLGEIRPEREAEVGVYLRRHQAADGSWPLFHGGDGDVSASVKAYWALKLIGDDPDAPHMAAARAWILNQGGAAAANVFTRISLALFGQIPWRGVPVMPVELMLLPQWFPFHVSKIAYWSRTVLIPLTVLMSHRAQAANPTGRSIRELFITPPEQHRRYNTNPTGSVVGRLFLGLDRVLRWAEPRLFPAGPRRRAVAKAMAFTLERLNGEDGLGGIYPAMANALMALKVMGYPDDHPAVLAARSAVEKLVIQQTAPDGQAEVMVQPCLSPVWDTCLGAHALLESGEKDDPALIEALDWLLEREITQVKGDWTSRRPDLKPAGWAFQYWNDHYPDVDDTAVVVMAMDRQGDQKYRGAVERACAWMVGMQSSNGGWGAFEPENEHFYLNSIPFADHGALLDPPTVDVTARVVGALAQVDATRYAEPIARAVAWIKDQQEPDGSWFGRWGANYVYGTWSALCALNAAGEDMSQPAIRKAVAWLKARQQADGGWGEDLDTYRDDRRDWVKSSTASQTAWALLGLMAAGEVDSPEVARGVAMLETAPKEGARWEETFWTGTGFPKVFYLKYHGYAAYFPLWAVARYQRLSQANDKMVAWGI